MEASTNDALVKLTVLLEQERVGHCTAQCIEYDLKGEGKTLGLAMVAFELKLIEEVEVDVYQDKPPLADCARPPDNVVKEFDELRSQSERLMQVYEKIIPVSKGVVVAFYIERRRRHDGRDQGRG